MRIKTEALKININMGTVGLAISIIGFIYCFLNPIMTTATFVSPDGQYATQVFYYTFGNIYGFGLMAFGFILALLSKVFGDD